MMTPEQIDAVLADLRTRLLSAREVTADARIGVTAIENWDTGYMEHEPTDGVTITFRINGGATDSRTVKGPA